MSRLTPLITLAEVLVAIAVVYRIFQKARAAWRMRQNRSADQ